MGSWTQAVRSCVPVQLMVEFGIVYDEWRAEPFPGGSAQDDLDELHARLATVDSWVAETVIPYVENDLYEPARVDVLGELIDICSELDRLRESFDESELKVARTYVGYADRLTQVYDEFLDAAPS